MADQVFVNLIIYAFYLCHVSSSLCTASEAVPARMKPAHFASRCRQSFQVSYALRVERRCRDDFDNTPRFLIGRGRKSPGPSCGRALHRPDCRACRHSKECQTSVRYRDQPCCWTYDFPSHRSFDGQSDCASCPNPGRCAFAGVLFVLCLLPC